MNDDAIPISKARDQFADLVNQVAYGHEHIILERHGKPVAAIIPVEDLEILRAAVEGRLEVHTNQKERHA